MWRVLGASFVALAGLCFFPDDQCFIICVQVYVASRSTQQTSLRSTFLLAERNFEIHEQKGNPEISTPPSLKWIQLLPPTHFQMQKDIYRRSPAVKNCTKLGPNTSHSFEYFHFTFLCTKLNKTQAWQWKLWRKQTEMVGLGSITFYSVWSIFDLSSQIKSRKMTSIDDKMIFKKMCRGEKKKLFWNNTLQLCVIDDKTCFSYQDAAFL